MKIKKGDKVIVISGQDKGKSGKVVRAFPKDEKVIVEGVNIKKRHQRANAKRQKGQVVDRTMPLHVSNVMIEDPKTGKPTRIIAKRVDGAYIRTTKKSGTKI
ncbi:MAG: 50S ribosomal protein L24 [Candidatus Pacebacteria bacterium]|jgi:large subunit ribosomal protein L24|nr:50S ribosomal protein L24 [bacterium]MDP6527301.1 50S ribosomal protein L24 [Candidatus Paceibacterota bacterium]MDP6659421.1 50S ribosomal protein L24 [Candidatus Paceibacterota bacterium]|tara:strand:- start:15524 stop:15829 length:306 start_codon:yes stop_codon:yes gene_type:complete